MASLPAPIATEKAIRWFNLTEPTAADLAPFAEEFEFHPLDVEDCLQDLQHPKIDEYKEYLFLVLHFPVVSQRTKRILTAGLNMFIGKDFIVTVSNGEFPALNQIVEKVQEEAKESEFWLKGGTGYFLYRLLKDLYEDSFPLINQLNRRALSLEKTVFDEDANAEDKEDLVRDILLLKKNIISFRRIIGPQRTVIERLEHKQNKLLPSSLDLYFDDIADQLERLWVNLTSLKEVAESIGEANETLISHQTNTTIKVLTIFSAIMLPLTFVTGLFGMNVHIPFENSLFSFAVIGLGLLAIAGSMIGFFYWRRWL